MHKVYSVSHVYGDEWNSCCFVFRLVRVCRASEEADEQCWNKDGRSYSWREYYLQVCAAWPTPRQIPKVSNPVHPRNNIHGTFPTGTWPDTTNPTLFLMAILCFFYTFWPCRVLQLFSFNIPVCDNNMFWINKIVNIFCKHSTLSNITHQSPSVDLISRFTDTILYLTVWLLYMLLITSAKV
jgi:hypothetical protein